MARSRRQRGPRRPRREATTASASASHLEATLGGLRQEVGLTQVQLAEKLAASQRAVSHVEHEPNPRVGTLAGYVEALGGRLELRAVFNDRSVALRLKDQP